ncbi:cysteine synthase A [Lysinibacillus endophyticus]|mgnify:FL=1|uniref:Cysteine synthase n=1 Tax=Ureibacillus endophyticus TaxID=1978490 RepID=A0A494YWW2_9BACL|nr:cysteine synthase A [Lysinibacillus endophyticus]MCP1143269.1 cysteine synthase A [Lysinibacillus endophyticus]RKQ14718.1 cysteine synthase A [Lysinibacillus endophyticus]
MSKLVNSVTELVGRTPIVKLNHATSENEGTVWVKVEFFNPGSSVKDRIALAMIEAAEKEGTLKPGGTIIEPTSGNTGIGLAMIAAAKGYRAILVMPETMSIERRKLLRAYGAELVLTPGPEGMKGAIAKAKSLAEENGYFLPQQFENQANAEIHRKTTGPEIVEAFESAGLKLDGFVAGIGTGGTITGAGEVLREKFPEIEIIAVEPKDSPVLSGGNPGSHKIQGIGAGFVPGVLNTEIYNSVFTVENETAFEVARKVGKEEGILVGISSGAAIHAAIETAKRLGKGSNVLAIVPSNGERYLSTALYNFED